MRMIIQTIVDAVVVSMACLLAAWLRFGIGLLPAFHDAPLGGNLYVTGAIIASVIVVLALHATRSYTQGRFTKPIGGLVLGVLLLLAGAFFFRTETPFSRIVLLLSAILIPVAVLVGRAVTTKLTGKTDESANHASQSATSKPTPGAGAPQRMKADTFGRGKRMKKHALLISSLIACCSCSTAVPDSGLRAEQVPAVRNLTGLCQVVLNRPIPLQIRTPPVRWHDKSHSLLAVTNVIFRLDQTNGLTATLEANVVTLHQVDYDVHAAVYASTGELLGTARTTCSIPCMIERFAIGFNKQLVLDFGTSTRYPEAKAFDLAISGRQITTSSDNSGRK